VARKSKGGAQISLPFYPEKGLNFLFNGIFCASPWKLMEITPQVYLRFEEASRPSVISLLGFRNQSLD